MTKLVPGANDFALLQPLQWNTRYEVEITARNVKGLSEPAFYQFFMPQKPNITGERSPATVHLFLFGSARKLRKQKGNLVSEVVGTWSGGASGVVQFVLVALLVFFRSSPSF